jgi:hypothetical protein
VEQSRGMPARNWCVAEGSSGLRGKLRCADWRTFAAGRRRHQASRTSSIVRPRAELNSTLESCCATSYWYVHDRKESRCGALALLSMAELPVGAASLLQ